MDVLYLIERETRRRGYSLRTTQTYLCCVRNFIRWVCKEPRRVTKADIQNFIDKLIDEGKSSSTVNVHVNAIKFLMQDILCKRILLRIKFSRVPKRLPVVLSKGEVKRLIEAVNNLVHKLIVELMYSAGLRVSEVVRLRACDIELERNYGWIRQGKGNKDRMFIIAKRLKSRLKDYIMSLSGPDSWLFPGRKGRHLHSRSPQVIVRKAAKRAGIRKKVHCHTLRHSFATHLIEDGYDVLSVQHVMGHADPQTTMVYVHTATPKMIKIKSPYDSFKTM